MAMAIEPAVSSDCHFGEHEECINGPDIRAWSWCQCTCHLEPDYQDVPMF